MEDFGRPPRNDYDNIQPRVGFALNVRGDGKDVIRGGLGIYTDTAYTNSNILFAAVDALGVVATGQFVASDPNGLRNPDGSYLSCRRSRLEDRLAQRGRTDRIVWRSRFPVAASSLTARQASFGWSHQLGPSIAFSADVIHADGRDLNVRARLNSRPGGGPRRFADLPLDPNSANFRVVISPLESVYDALLVGLRRQSATGVDFALNYTLSRAESDLGQGVDETGLGPNTILDATNPFAPVQFGLASSDARHLVSLSAIIPIVWRIQVAPIIYYRSASARSSPSKASIATAISTTTTSRTVPSAFDGVGQPPRDIGALSDGQLRSRCGIESVQSARVETDRAAPLVRTST